MSMHLFACLTGIVCTGVLPAYCNSQDNKALETWDTTLQCNRTLKQRNFEPYAPDYPWPHSASSTPP